MAAEPGFRAIWLWWYALPIAGLVFAKLALLWLTIDPPHDLKAAIGQAENMGALTLFSLISAVVITIAIVIKSLAKR